MTRKLTLLPLLFFLLPVLLIADGKNDKETPPPLQHEIVVTATRLETPAKEVASSITVITKAQIEKMNRSTLLEVLQEVPGLMVIQNGGKGAAANIFLRGANSEHTLVLMDGIELNDPMTPSRSSDLAHLSLQNVERIEILRGPQSTLYGSDALGGVINIITQRGTGKPKVALSSGGGSYGTVTSAAGLSGASKKGNYSLGISYLQTRGITAASQAYAGNKERDGYRNFSFSGRLGYSPNPNLDFDLVLHALTTKTDIDNYGGAYGDDPNNYQFYDSVFIKGQIRTLGWKNRWEQKLGLAVVSSQRKNQNDPDDAHLFDSERGFFKSRLVKVDWQNNFFLHESNTLTVGAAYEQEQGNSEYDSQSVWGPYTSVFPLQKESIAGIYVQDQIRLAGRLFTTVGLRFDRHRRSGEALTYRIAPAYVIEQTGTKIKATLGTAFKSPSLYQLYAPGTMWGRIGNLSLKPEEARGWDAGVEQSLWGGRILVGATYFSNTYKNLINFEMVQGYVNIGRAVSRGVEVTFEASPLRSLLCRASYTRTEARDKDQDTYLLRRPKDKAQANLDYQFTSRGHLSAGVIFIGRREDIDYADWPYPRISLPGYALLNAALSYDLASQVQVFANLENILDAKYEMIYGYGTPGFSVFGGVKLNF